MTETINITEKPLCRLCYESDNLIDIYSENGLLYDFETKITKYLYLQVSRDDDLPKTICWMCSEHLETFHKFYERINNIQRNVLDSQRYEFFVLKPFYNSTDIIDEKSSVVVEKEPITLINANLVEEENTEENTDNYIKNNVVFECESAIQNKDDFHLIVKTEDPYEIKNMSEEQSLSVIDELPQSTEIVPLTDDRTIEIMFSDTSENMETNLKNDIPIIQECSVKLSKENELIQKFEQTNAELTVKSTPVKVKSKKVEKFLPENRKQDQQNCRQTRSKALLKLNVEAPSEPVMAKRRGRPKRKLSPVLKIEPENPDSDLEDIYGCGDDDDRDKDFLIDDKKSLDIHNIEDMDDEPEEAMKRKRGRPKGVRNKLTKIVPQKFHQTHDDDIEESRSKLRSRKSILRKNRDLPMHDIEEGESDNEFPARDSDNEDWPAQTTLNRFPDKILENGLLLVKGKKLMTMICQFYKLDCDICVKEKPRFKHLRQLFSHYAEQHNEEGYVTCCQTKLSRYPAIIMHMARHLQPDAFKCDVCGYMVTRPRFLESHKQTHLPEDQKPFACNQCPRRFCWKGALQIHMISHQPVNERKLYVCHICGKVYDTPGGLSTHKKLIHTDRKSESHVCHVCAKKFATRTGLNEHMATIHQPREKDQVQCLECGKWLMNNRCLKSHMVLHSSVVYNCRICDYTTKKQMLLRRHLLTQHSDEKPFNCEICGKSFKLKRALTVHVAQHNSTKTFKCTFCTRVFASSTNFYTHRKNMHPKELQAMKDRELEEQRQKRIRAGVEDDLIACQSLTLQENDNIPITVQTIDEHDGHHILNAINESESMEDIDDKNLIQLDGKTLITNGGTTIITRLPIIEHHSDELNHQETLILNVEHVQIDQPLVTHSQFHHQNHISHQT